MRVLLLGGVRSGKSSLAQQIALKLSTGNHYYVATMIPVDADDRQRIALHLKDREGMGFQTIEQGRHIEECLDSLNPESTVLLDSVTALYMNELFLPELDFALDDTAANRVAEGLEKLADTAENVVFVSDYLFSDAVKYDASTEHFRMGLGEIHLKLAHICDTVIEVTSGHITVHKGGLPT